jgi:hypothetical protein
MDLKERVNAFAELGKKLRVISETSEVLSRAYYQNSWFTEKNISYAANVWADTLSEVNINEWLKPYTDNIPKEANKRVGVINAGNIPFVGLHDFVTVLISGNSYVGKNASDDSVLLPYVSKLLCEIEPRFMDKIQFIEKLGDVDAVIATGSNNTSRYFEYYFSKYPHIIRKNRNAVAVLNGKESQEDLHALGRDIFQYFGLGCRNVSKLYVPRGYDFKLFFETMVDFSDVMQHNKYMNNFEYNNAVLLLKRIPFLQNGFLIIFEDKRIPSPIAVLHYEYYETISGAEESLRNEKESIQCIVSTADLNVGSPVVRPGQTQMPALWDYSDGVNTMEFLIGLNG